MSEANPYQGYHAQLLEKLERLECENAALRAEVKVTRQNYESFKADNIGLRAAIAESEEFARKNGEMLVSKARELLAENAALRTVLKRWLKVADDCHQEQQEVGYSEYNITAGLMVDTRALCNAARKEAQS